MRWSISRGEIANQQGFALVVVILILLMVSFLAAELTLGVRSETTSGFNARQQVVGRILAQAGVNLGIFYLLDTPLAEDEEQAYLLGDSRDIWLADGLVRYQVVNEAGKIDINYVQQPLLALVLSSYGLDEDDIAIISDSLLDWRDSDDLHRLHGAENDYYEGLAEPYRSRDGKIKDPNEFFLIRGTEKLAGRMRAADIFTTHNRQGKVDFNQLTPAMLNFLTNGDEEAKDLYGQLRQEVGTLSAVHAQLILGDERYAEVKPYLSYSSPHNKFYTIVATGYAGEVQAGENDHNQGAARANKGPGSHVAILLEKRGGKIRYLSWREYWS